MRSNGKNRTARALLLTLVLAAPVAVVLAGDEPPTTRERADAQFEKKNYADAARLYGELLEAGPPKAEVPGLARQVIACRLRMQDFELAFDAARDLVERVEGTPWEPRAERLLGNLWLNVPHWGTRMGGTFHRATWGQGIRLRTERHDKQRAIGHLERARELYAHWDDPARAAGLAVLPEEDRAGWREERLAAVMDLAGAWARFGIYENEWRFWYLSWGQRDDFLAETAGEEDFDEYYGYWEWRRKRPIGLQVDDEGRPVFPTRPKSYADSLDDDHRILALLHEVRELDPAGDGHWTATSWYRQAMLARTRFGMDRMHGYAGLYRTDDGQPLEEELKEFDPWTLGDDEALVLAGGRLRVVELPEEWDVLALLARAAGDPADPEVAPEARYASGVYRQSRQQYDAALAEYAALAETFPDHDRAEDAGTQRERILRREVELDASGAQLPGEPARLSFTHRNVDRVWFVAHRIDPETFLRTIREQDFEETEGLRHFWSLRNWDRYFVHAWDRGSNAELTALATRCIGEEVGRWSVPLPDDGTHRYAQATAPTPMETRGAYLVVAHLSEPPPAPGPRGRRALLAIGASRAVVLLNDLAFVEKQTAEGRLWFVCDARTGAPVPGARVQALEYWSVYDRGERKSRHYRRLSEVTADPAGLARLERANPHGSRLHALVTAGTGDDRRVAWTGMHYWSDYEPSSMADGRYVYAVTDRPVYRPGQTVQYRISVRHRREGGFANAAHESVTVTIHDARGDEVDKRTLTTDEWGGVDGSWTLGDEPRLGMYQVRVAGRSVGGGIGFRVEEYKKPEFEVTVEPSKEHTKLGDGVEAVVSARYYFGAPVSEGTVSYRVFREEYRHRMYPGGPWTWLYGPGYGLGWYEYPWFDWWQRVRSCRVPPPWWNGGGRSPVRELVAQGDGALAADGTLRVAIDTAPALRDHPDRDHRYVIEAEVRDPSRRVIEGQGAVLATRSAYYAQVTSDRGWVRPGEEFELTVRCVAPDGRPVAASGVLTVESVRFGGRDNARIESTEVGRYALETDGQGRATLRLRHEASGQLVARFTAPDAWGGTVEGFGWIWVAGDDFDGTLHRFPDLEILTDKRTYAPGETARVMIHTAQADSWVLFSDDVDANRLRTWRLLHLPGHAMVVDIPIREEHGPNFFLEATTIAATRLHERRVQICVPPVDGVMDVTVHTDKPEYRPGEEATVKVTAHGPDGEPVRAQFALSAFDRSVLYIQPELAPAIGNFFHGRLRSHSIWSATNLYERFATQGGLERPWQRLDPLPDAWWAVWGPDVDHWGSVEGEELDRLGLGGGAPQRKGGELAERRARGGARAPGAPAAEAETMDGGDFAGAPAESAAMADDDGGGLVEATVRRRFADTAHWLPTLTTGADGTATTTFRMPENLTTWKVNAWGLTKDTRVGQAETSAVTTKDLLVRLQAPRFFLERDEVVVSANVHNYLDEAKRARVSLDLPADLLEPIGDTPLELDVDVPAGGQARVDWRVAVRREGTAALTVTARTDVESDAMRVDFPVLVHGMSKQVSSSGTIRPDEADAVRTVTLEVPEQRRPELTRLEVRYAPSLIGSMIDALPYCLDYPYGCTEQTLARFLPAVLTRRTLQTMGLSLEDLRSIRQGRLEEVRRIEEGEGRRYSTPADSPVFDEARMTEILHANLQRLATMQNGDGGWGWWSGNTSSSYLTAYVLHGLMLAREADVAVDDAMIRRGLDWLENDERQDLAKEHWSVHAGRAFAALVLARGGRAAEIEPKEDDERPGALIERLWQGRDRLNLYGKALLCLALEARGDDARATTALENILQYRRVNEKTQVAWFETPPTGWWYWWNNDVETHAWILRALVRVDPGSDLAPMVVKWLLENRRNGYYWRSTRDTTLCVSAMAEFVAATGEGRPDCTITLDLDDGAVVKTVRITKDNFFTYDDRFVVEGVALGGGTHTLRITREGTGALYFTTRLSYFTKEEHIAAAGHEIEVERRYFRLRQIPYEVEVEDARGNVISERRLRYERVPLAEGDVVESGEVVQVELAVTADNDYTYLAFEDRKPAGFEPVELRSGAQGQEGFASYMELRDEKVAFFVAHLGRGTHLMRYRLRAEIPGVFHALPTSAFGMYAPEIRANSAEQVLGVKD